MKSCRPQYFCLLFLLTFLLSWSPQSFAGQPDKTPPTTPTILIFTSLSCGRITLIWSPSIDANAQTISGLAGYYILRNGIFLQQILAPTNSFTDNSVAPLVNYSYGVAAFDNASNVSPTNTLSITIPLCPDTTAPP